MDNCRHTCKQPHNANPVVLIPSDTLTCWLCAQLQSRALPPRPTGAFGQQFPQNCPRLPSQPSASASTSKANRAATPLEQQLVAMGAHREADRVDADGLPHVGSIIWPGQVSTWV